MVQTCIDATIDSFSCNRHLLVGKVYSRHNKIVVLLPWITPKERARERERERENTNSNDQRVCEFICKEFFVVILSLWNRCKRHSLVGIASLFQDIFMKNMNNSASFVIDIIAMVMKIIHFSLSLSLSLALVCVWVFV